MNQPVAIEISLTGQKTIQQINIRIKTLALEFSSEVGNIYYIHNSDTYMVPLVAPAAIKTALLEAIRQIQKKYGFIIVNENIYEQIFNNMPTKEPLH